jgi:regulatory protein
MCLRLLADRPRTKAELKKKLTAIGIPAEAAEHVLGRLNVVGLVDDAAFAEQWVHSRHRYQGMARRALVAELRRKGVDNAVAAEAADAVDGEAEETRARDLVRKRLRSVTGQDELTKVRRLVGMLARKGYPEGMSYRVVREELKTAGEETDLLDDTPLE